MERSHHWPAVERAHLRLSPVCLVCGCTAHLNVHHWYPFHFVVAVGRPDLELDHRNLFTLCSDPAKQHHLLVGHLDEFGSFTRDLHRWIAVCKSLTSREIRLRSDWRAAVRTRPKALEYWGAPDRTALRAELDHLFPPGLRVT